MHKSDKPGIDWQISHSSTNLPTAARLANTTIILFLIPILFVITQVGCKTLGTVSTQATVPLPTSTVFSIPNTGIETLPASAIPTVTDTPILPAITPSITPTPAPDYFSRGIPLGGNSFIIPLTVRHVSEESASLFFELRDPANGRLVYRSLDSEHPFQAEFPFLSNETRHMLILEGLVPGVHYQAMVLLEESDNSFTQPTFNGADWGMVNFKTVSSDSPIKVGVLGDASFGDDATHTLITLMASQGLDFVLNTGDVVYETDSSDLVNSYAIKFFEPFSPLLHQLSVYTVIGNHDYDRALEWQGAPFYDYAFPPFFDPNFTYPASRRGNQYYAFAYQDIQFLMLDSQVLFGEEGRSDQEAWIKERLADTRYRTTIPVLHVAPYSSSSVHPNDSLPVRYSWLPIFEAARVPLVFSGHFHHYERLTANGVTCIVSGGGSSTLYAQGTTLPESQIYIRRTHFVRMDIYDDRIEISAIAKEGDIFDQATITLK